MISEQIVELDGASLRAAAIVTEGYKPDAPLLVIEASAPDGRHVVVHLRATGAGGARELAEAATVVADAAEAASAYDDRVRHMAAEIDDSRGGA